MEALNPRIKVSSPSFSKNDHLRRSLLSVFPNSGFNASGKKLEGMSLASFLKDADGAIVGLEKISGGILRKLKKLKVISKYGVGMDNVDQRACDRHGVALLYSPGTNSASVAELTLCCMISLLRNVSLTSSELKKGFWHKDGGRDLSGKTIGIIGVGNVGKEVIRLLAPFSCKILVNDIIDQTHYYDQRGLISSSKQRIFRESDVVTIHVPLTSQTRNLVHADTLKLMKRDSILINTSRGEVVNQASLKQTLKSKKIFGAAIDVYREEPPSDMEFLSLPNLLCTPHIGGNSREAVRNMGKTAIENLIKFFQEGRRGDHSRPLGKAGGMN